MNYTSINEAYNLNNYDMNIDMNNEIDNNNANDKYIIDLDDNNDNDNDKNNNKINSIKLLNTYKNLNNNLNTNIELIENLENNKMTLFNFLSSIYNKHTECIDIFKNDLYNNDNNSNNDNNPNKYDEYMMNYIETFNDLYNKWNNEIYIKKKKEIEKKIEEDQIQLNGLRKIFITTTNEIINIDNNNEKNIKNTCPICFENEVNMVAIPCGHVCCNICIMKNLKYNNGKCLCCRNPLKDYIKIFIQI